ncbi:MAG: ATP-dependent helicase [Candidatus Bathyarchaeota archaeon]|nr:ATP-dependent helicase [Candidatus Bathyarchaeota archaeon]
MPIPFEKLYPKQKEVVIHKGGPLLVLAGPGTGKTEVLTHRTAFLTNCCGVNPAEILAITFSRKATREMTERLEKFEGFEENQPRTSTLHAEAFRVMNDIDASKRYLLGGEETRLLLMDAALDLGLKVKARELKRLQRDIGLLKANCKGPNHILCIDEQTKNLKKLFERYEELLSFNHAIGLDGLIMKAVGALSSGENNFKSETRHLLVDEYQDINQAEFQFIKILAQNVDSLFVVGDDDQSIYGWRGADPNIIRSFKKDFSGAHGEILEESHRCTGHILEGAQAIVSKDPQYQYKPIYSVKGDGSPIHIVVSKSWTAEGIWIANWIGNSISKGQFKPSEIVILCKVIKLADFLGEQLRIVGIDTVYWRPSRLFTNEITLNILAHVRLIVDKEDNLALRRCVDTPTGRGVGKRGVMIIRRLAEKHSCSLWEIMLNVHQYSKLQRWRDSIEGFVNRIQKMEDVSSDQRVSETIKMIAKEIGASGSAVDRLNKFAASLTEEMDLEDFMGEVNRNRGLDLAGGVAEPEDEKEAVTIMSMHSSKGLTYEVAFLLGLEEGIFPNPTQDLNEQRRLCYVAMTRARQELFLCYCKALKGKPARGLKFYNPSSFLYALPKEHREVIENL